MHTKNIPTAHTESNILFLSELGHVDAYKRFLDARPDVLEEGYVLIPLDAEIEYALTKKGIAFQSGKEYRTLDITRMVLSEEWTSSIFESRQWLFFAYRGVSLGQLYFPQLQGYLNRILYYTDIVSNAVVRHPSVQRFIVFSSSSVRPTTGSCLVGHQIDALVDVVINVAKQSGKEVFVSKIPLSAPTRNRFAVFALKRALFGCGIMILNFFVALMRRPGRVRILASDYWRNLAPSLQCLGSAEVLLLDRQEVFSAGISNIWKFRMRFLHLNAFSTGIFGEQKRVQTLFKHEWQSIRKGPDLSVFLFRGFSIQLLLTRALDSIITEAVTRTLGDINDAHTLIVRLKPTVVMLRATISAQTHFSILAQVARKQGIPSIEMQHGLMYFGPGSTGKRHQAEYMGVYGPFVRREMQAAGDNRSTSIIIGSPRFDVYTSIRSAMSESLDRRLTFLCIAPIVFLEESTDSYDVLEYFQAIALALQKIPNAHVIIKLRPGPNRDDFLLAIIKSLFDGISYTIAQFEPLSELYSQADIVVSGYSTAALEALQCGKPLVYLSLCPLERMTGRQHFTAYEEHGALRIADTKEALTDILGELSRDPNARNSLSKKAVAFLAREYEFDGKASQRAAAFISSFVSKESR